MLQQSSHGNVPDRARLEAIFRSRFSSPNIEDEYSYNLSYLISQNMFGSGSIPSKASKPKGNGFRKKECQETGNFTGTGKFRDQMDDLPVKQCAESKPNEESRRNRPVTSNILQELPRKPAYEQQFSSCVDGREPMQRGSLWAKKYEHRKGMESTKVARKAFVSAHQPSESAYPGLHIYVTESPPRSFYDVMSSTDTPTHYFHGKSVACDPIASKPKPLTRQHKIRVETADTIEKEQILHQLDHKLDHKLNQDTNATGIPSVASRIEALFSTMQLQDGYPIYEPNNETSSPARDQDMLSNSIEEQIHQPPTVRLQRSATFSTNRRKVLNSNQASEYCFTCCKRTYAVDRIAIGDRTYHKGCFRCVTCLRTLLPGTFASLDGVILCKPHYIEQFRRAGRYEVRKSLTRGDESEHTSTANLSCEE